MKELKYSYYTKEEINILIKMRHKGANYREIAMVLQRPYGSVVNKARRLGVGMGRGNKKCRNEQWKMTAEILGWIRKRLSEGWSIGGISIVLNIPENEIIQAINGNMQKYLRKREMTPCMIPLDQIKVCFEKRCHLNEKCPVYGNEIPSRIGNYTIRER